MLGTLLGALVAAAAAVGATTPVARAADRPPDAKRGLAVARKWCSPCHVVETGQKRTASDAAPPFADVANDPRMTRSRLRGILVQPHARMPTDALYREEIADLIAYIRSLRRR